MKGAMFYPYGSRVCMLKIVSYEGRNPAGFLQNPSFEKEQPFENLTQLLFAMEALFDSLNSPQRAMKPRRLVNAPVPAVEPERTPPKKTALATFRVDVMFRQNASWQGGVVWVEGKRETQFRSVLELVGIMDSVLASVS